MIISRIAKVVTESKVIIELGAETVNQIWRETKIGAVGMMWITIC